MSIQPPPFLAPLLPDNAPFSPIQRAWLNGFFAGLLSLEGPGAAPLAPEQAQALLPGVNLESPSAGPGDGDDGAAPWHDPTLPLADRMEMATGRPLRRRMMAAMAQQDCGQCGYTCEAYSDALAGGAETRLNLCQPGGKETLRMLKKLAAERDGEADAPKPAATGASQIAAASPAGSLPGYSREHPVKATFLSRRRLNKGASAKQTWHLDFRLPEGLDYAAGDSFGLLPANAPELVDAVMACLGLAPDTLVDGRRVRETLLRDKALGAAPDALFTLLAETTADLDEKVKLARLAEGEDPDGDLDTTDVLAALGKSSALPETGAFLAALDPLQPRLYSISSSPKAAPGQLSLTVDTVRYDVGSRSRLGVASTFLADRIEPGAQLPVYVQKAHGFALPASGAIPIIMVGPGTGIAPFRAFLQERLATDATGGAWLFFGHQRRDSDFFYQEELEGLQAAGALTRLSLAWSRDGARKVYVQDRMREEGAALFDWLERGAHFYICGDAKRMAADVDKALHAVVEQHGARDAAAAKAYIAALKAAGRYQADVY
ncbi:sulfite reductase subunit alpha [Ancylobacter sp. A5.8]|uniref:sulfite reductase subunit alpha n=1 Tax=Ancylobacter gelatini TaxID=2919920 RepID=UPI001F4E3D40|nr:sulfite reductase subunit alpha [Ancylobacter gelatini]MCJ8143415.1 sulfite reductase subunit alpha [Ancylobacter gelatini]